jgi:hypothetical protein
MFSSYVYPSHLYTSLTNAFDRCECVSHRLSVDHISGTIAGGGRNEQRSSHFTRGFHHSTGQG